MMGNVDTFRLRLEFLFLAIVCIGTTSCHDTVYAPNFSEEKFDSIHQGDSVEEVVALIGKPIYKYTFSGWKLWDFDSIDSGILLHTCTIDGKHGYYVLRVGLEVLRHPEDGVLYNEENFFSLDELTEKFGTPTSKNEYDNVEVWHYTRSPGHGNQYHRYLRIDRKHGLVIEKRAYFRID